MSDADAPEITLLDLISTEFTALDVKARHRVLQWMISWSIDDKRKASDTAARVEAFAIVSLVAGHIRGEERDALIAALNALVTQPPSPSSIRPAPRLTAPRRKRMRCSRCKAEGHTKRTCSMPRERELEME